MNSISNELKFVIKDVKTEAKTDQRFIFFLRSYIPTICPLVVLLCLAPVLKQFLFYPFLLFVVTGFTQNALGIMMHEGSHFFFMKNKKWNDVLSNFFVCYILMNTVESYRKEHMHHHKYSGEENDPYNSIYSIKSKREFLKALLLDFFLITAVEKFSSRYLKPAAVNSQKEQKTSGDYLNLAGLALTHLFLLLLYFYISGTIFAYFVFWILPLMIIPSVINRFRTFVEHYCTVGDEEAKRSIVPNLFEKILIAPYGYSYHFIHHSTTSIPYYLLKSSHQKLIKSGIIFKETELGQGYLRTFLKLYKTLPDR